MEHDPVAMALQRAVDVPAQHLAVPEADGDLAGRRLGHSVLGQGQLDPLHRGERDPGHLVVLDAADVIDLDDEIGLVEVEVLRPPLERLVVEETNVDLQLSSYPSILTSFRSVSCAVASSRRRILAATPVRRACASSARTPPGAGGRPRPGSGEASRPGTGPGAGRPPGNRARRIPRGPRTPP